MKRRCFLEHLTNSASHVTCTSLLMKQHECPALLKTEQSDSQVLANRLCPINTGNYLIWPQHHPRFRCSLLSPQVELNTTRFVHRLAATVPNQSQGAKFSSRWLLQWRGQIIQTPAGDNTRRQFCRIFRNYKLHSHLFRMLAAVIFEVHYSNKLNSNYYSIFLYSKQRRLTYLYA